MRWNWLIRDKRFVFETRHSQTLENPRGIGKIELLPAASPNNYDKYISHIKDWYRFIWSYQLLKVPYQSKRWEDNYFYMKCWWDLIRPFKSLMLSSQQKKNVVPEISEYLVGLIECSPLRLGLVPTNLCNWWKVIHIKQQTFDLQTFIFWHQEYLHVNESSFLK